MRSHPRTRSNPCGRRLTFTVLALLALLVPWVRGARAAVPADPRAPVAGATQLILSSPLPFQVFQRRTRLSGAIAFKGDAAAGARLEVRISGASLAGALPGGWQRIPGPGSSRSFAANVAVPAGGPYTVEVRSTPPHAASSLVRVDHVGVGEVFVVSGQSNSTNYGEVLQRSETGMVSSFDGTAWAPADDPQPGVQDHSTRGSFIPAFGDELSRRYRVPIGIASVGHGSTSVRQWLPAGDPVSIMPTMTRYIVRDADGTLRSDGTLFRGMVARIRQLGPHGFRAVLWHQGESDSHQPAGHEIAASTYRRMMVRIIRASRREAGWQVPWLVAQATYHTPDDTSCPPIRDAQSSLWRPGLAEPGPDTDTLTGLLRQNLGKGTHLSDAGLKAHGQLWAQAVSRYLDRVAAQHGGARDRSSSHLLRRPATSARQ